MERITISAHNNVQWARSIACGGVLAYSNGVPNLAYESLMSHRAVCWAAGDRNRGEQCLWKAGPPCARKETPRLVAHMSQHGHHHVALKLQRFGLGGGGAGVPTTFPPRSLHVSRN